MVRGLVRLGESERKLPFESSGSGRADVDANWMRMGMRREDVKLGDRMCTVGAPCLYRSYESEICHRTEHVGVGCDAH